MFLSRESIYPFSPLFFRERTLFARGDRSSFLFFLLSLLSLLLPFVLTGGQRDILLLFCLLARISLRIPWATGGRSQRRLRLVHACLQIAFRLSSRYNAVILP